MLQSIAVLLITLQLTSCQKCIRANSRCVNNNILSCCAGSSCYKGHCKTCSFFKCKGKLVINPTDCCVEGDACVNNRCIWCVKTNGSCTSKEGCCDNNDFCIRGKCIRTEKPGGNCTVSEQCSEVQNCHGGKCQNCIRRGRRCKEGPKNPECCGDKLTCQRGTCRECCPTVLSEGLDICIPKVKCCDPEAVWKWTRDGNKICVRE